VADTGKSKGDVAVVAGLMTVLLFGIVGLVVLVSRGETKPPPLAPASASSSVASAPPPPPNATWIIVNPASSEPPVVATEMPVAPTPNTPLDIHPTPTAVPKYGLGDQDPAGMVLDSEAIRSTIAEHKDELRKACYVKYSPANASVHLTLHIERDGSVSSTEIASSMGPPEVGTCVAAQAKTWKFRQSSEGATVRYPFFFQSQ
jgi:hypothetical protein